MSTASRDGSLTDHTEIKKSVLYTQADIPKDIYFFNYRDCRYLAVNKANKPFCIETESRKISHQSMPNAFFFKTDKLDVSAVRIIPVTSVVGSAKGETPSDILQKMYTVEKIVNESRHGAEYKVEGRKKTKINNNELPEIYRSQTLFPYYDGQTIHVRGTVMYTPEYFVTIERLIHSPLVPEDTEAECRNLHKTLHVFDKRINEESIIRAL
jgi:hypothetical protein